MVPAEPSVSDLPAANAAAAEWCGEVNAAVHSEVCAVPADRLDAERELLGATARRSTTAAPQWHLRGAPVPDRGPRPKPDAQPGVGAHQDRRSGRPRSEQHCYRYARDDLEHGTHAAYIHGCARSRPPNWRASPMPAASSSTPTPPRRPGRSPSTQQPVGSICSPSRVTRCTRPDRPVAAAATAAQLLTPAGWSGPG
jgi:hypothetical protein